MTPSNSISLHLSNRYNVYYVCDLSQPFHTDQLERWDGQVFDEVLIHKTFEADVRKLGLDRLETETPALPPAEVTDPEAFAIRLAEGCSDYYTQIVRAYYLAPAQIVADAEARLASVWSIAAECCAQAVWATHSLWMALGNLEVAFGPALAQDFALYEAGQLMQPDAAYLATAAEGSVLLQPEVLAVTGP